MTWPALRPGDRIRVVAPSGPFDPEALVAGISILQERFEVVTRRDIGARKGYLAGDDARRAEELLEAVADDRTRGIIAARGGYGATRILSRVAPAVARSLARSPKLMVGCSDITALHALWQANGVGSLHAHMVTRLAQLSPALRTRFLDALEGPPSEAHTRLRGVTAGRAEGPLCGGNLAVLYALLGTPHFPDWTGAIVVLEDVNEPPYAIDRMLTALRQTGALAGAAGVVLGAFTRCPPGAHGTDVEEVFTDRLGDLGVPVAMGLSAGHIEDNRELPFGARATLDATAGTLTIADTPVVAAPPP